jgi:hypothetical protein
MQDLRQTVRLKISLAILTAGASFSVAKGVSPSEKDEIPPWTLALEQRLQPWCPAGCVEEVPFTVTYSKGGSSLVFVGVHHVFTPQNPTIRAVDSGFAKVSPAIVIVEGFPTTMGENPPPLVKEAQTRGTPEADDFARGEAMYAASLALTRGIPFLGGEPTRAEQVQALERRGYAPKDIAFAYLVGGLSQSLRSGDIAGPNDPKLIDAFARWAHVFKDQYKFEPMSFGDFAVRYRSMFGVEVTHDAALAGRSEAGTESPVALLNQTDRLTRDEHLLATIEKELALKKRVLVVYGGSHWTTLSQALQKKHGKPETEPFLR